MHLSCGVRPALAQLTLRVAWRAPQYILEYLSRCVHNSSDEQKRGLADKFEETIWIGARSWQDYNERIQRKLDRAAAEKNLARGPSPLPSTAHTAAAHAALAPAQSRTSESRRSSMQPQPTPPTQSTQPTQAVSPHTPHSQASPHRQRLLPSPLGTPSANRPATPIQEPPDEPASALNGTPSARSHHRQPAPPLALPPSDRPASADDQYWRLHAQLHSHADLKLLRDIEKKTRQASSSAGALEGRIRERAEALSSTVKEYLERLHERPGAAGGRSKGVSDILKLQDLHAAIGDAMAFIKATARSKSPLASDGDAKGGTAAAVGSAAAACGGCASSSSNGGTIGRVGGEIRRLTSLAPVVTRKTPSPCRPPSDVLMLEAELSRALAATPLLSARRQPFAVAMSRLRCDNIPMEPLMPLPRRTPTISQDHAPSTSAVKDGDREHHLANGEQTNPGKRARRD